MNIAYLTVLSPQEIIESDAVAAVYKHLLTFLKNIIKK